MNSEPVVAGYTVTALLAIVVNLLVVFDWWNPTAEQQAAVTAVVVAVASIVSAFLTRRAVTPVASARPLPPPGVKP